uniref:NB-ARC domain-containing protein n=1 Tax=Quercus lobata TaxID=97700 RepID=A0A7N2R474_QUELO
MSPLGTSFNSNSITFVYIIDYSFIVHSARQMIDEAKKIHRNLDKLKDKIRNLQVRPIEDERQALVQKDDKKFVEDLIAGVQKVDNLIPEVKKEDKDEPIAGTSDLPGDIKPEIQSFTLYWAPFRAFLIDLQSSGLETKTEKAWLEEAKEIINKAQHAIDKFIKNTRKWKWMLSYFSNQREIDPLQSISGTSQEQASNNVQISENGSGNFNNELEKLKKTYEKSLKKESLERLQALCTTFTKAHGEAAEKEEGIKSSTEEEKLKQIKKLTEKTKYYLGKYEKNSDELGYFCKCRRRPVKKLHEKFDKIKEALEIIEETTKAYKFEIRKEMGVVGLDEDIQAVASQLITGNKHVVCVVGMKGIGKTTLAKNIYRHSDILEHFPARAWVTLTDLKTNDYDAIFKDVAKQVSEPDINGSQEEENRRGEWKNKVCAILKKKKYFVVLDDFTAENDWETLKAAFPETILLTTRDQCVVRTVCGKLHCLRLRTKEESCRLFIQMMGDDFDLAPKDVKKLAEETVGRCGGWPHQILHLGYLMSTEDDKLQEWPKSITPAQEPWLKYLKIEGHITLKNWLESRKIEINDWSDHEGKNDLLDNLRKFFAFFFSLFPRDYEIPARRLVALSIAEGLGLGEEGRDKNKTTRVGVGGRRS